jgi:hypothetical protein
MDTTAHHSAVASVSWIEQIRSAAPGAIALALIVASIVAWTAILDRALSALP